MLLEKLLSNASLPAWSMFFLSVCFVLIATRVITSLSFYWALRSVKTTGRSPPILPYWIPLLGNAISFIRDGPSLCQQLVKKYGYSIPIGVKVGHQVIYLVGDPAQVTKLLRPTQNLASGGSAASTMMTSVLGMSQESASLYAEDDSGPHVKPLPGSTVAFDRRIRYADMKMANRYLLGEKAVKMGDRYGQIFQQNLAISMSVHKEWIELPDLFTFVKNLVFPAGAEALCGSALLELNPNLAEDFWKFHNNTPKFLYGWPRWLRPAMYKNRDRLLSSVKKWHEFANSHCDYTKIETYDPEWDIFYGSKYVKARQKMFQELDNVTHRWDHDARAASDLGLIFAFTANSAISVFWTIFEVYSRPNLLSQVQSIFDTTINKEGLTFMKAGQHPLLLSIFAEVTRLRVLGLVPRACTQGKFDFQGWTFPKSSLIVLSSNVGGMNENIWNQGSDEEPHPIDEFWAERFIVYADKPQSGPVRKKPSSEGSSKDPTPEKLSDRIAAGHGIFSTEGLQGSFIPFGGGPGKCPGRDFARQEVIISLALFTKAYEMQLLTPEGWQPRMDHTFFPLGALPPVEPIPFRIRRRTS